MPHWRWLSGCRVVGMNKKVWGRELRRVGTGMVDTTARTRVDAMTSAGLDRKLLAMRQQRYK
eukprot:1178175-Prorocentrum_minimum.AAC.1